MLRLPLTTASTNASRAASTRARLPRIPPHTSPSPIATLDETLANKVPGKVVMPSMGDMGMWEKGEVGSNVPLTPDAYFSAHPSAGPISPKGQPGAEDYSQFRFMTVSHPSTHVGGGPSSTGAAQ
ncbi:hypothetical protein JCM11641_006506 [Rhodosporidiobolus odoratus]